MSLKAGGRAIRRTSVVLALVTVALIGLMPALSGTASAAPLQGGEQLPGVYAACNVKDASRDLSYPADTSFYVAHGWAQPGWTDPSITTPIARRATLSATTFFELFIDGTRVPSIPWLYYNRVNDWFAKGNVSNFPDGMPEGTYTFVANWYFDGSLMGGTFGESVLASGCSMTVTFYEQP